MVQPAITVLVLDHSSSLHSRAIGLLHHLGPVTAVYVPARAEALRFLEKQIPEIILVELQDGTHSPLEWLTEVRSRSPLVPVALLAEPGGEQLLVEALRDCASDWIYQRNPEYSTRPTLERFLSLGRNDARYHRLAGYMIKLESCLELGNDQTLLPVILGYLQEELMRSKFCDQAESVQVGIALSEALMNALYHGNLEVSSSLRNLDDCAYFSLAEFRQSQSPYKERRIHLNVRIDGEQATFVVRDEGPGFDTLSLPDPTDPANLEKGSGRGVLLIRSFMDEVIYNDSGNQVTMVKMARALVEEAK